MTNISLKKSINNLLNGGKVNLLFLGPDMQLKGFGDKSTLQEKFVKKKITNKKFHKKNVVKKKLSLVFLIF